MNVFQEAAAMKAKRILCLALTLMLMLSLGMVTAYAEGETTTTMVEPDDFDTAGFSKILWIAEGLPLTGIDIGNNTTADINAFTFSFTGRVSDTVTDETVIPAIANKTVTVGTDRQGDYTTGTLTYQAIFGDAPGPSTVDFPHAGEYIYTVREVAPNPAINNIVLGEEPNTVNKNLDAAADAYYAAQLPDRQYRREDVQHDRTPVCAAGPERRRSEPAGA